MKLLFLGDIFGKPGRQVVEQFLPTLRQERSLDVVVANGENAARGRGINQKIAQSLFAAGVDVITTGNHAFDVQESFSYFASEKHLLRPANYPEAAPGRGYVIKQVLGGIQLAVINLMGRVHMHPIDCPFAAADRVLAEIKAQADVVFVDMHAEATSETRAMGWHLDGKVAAVLGSHTHVQTADEEILPAGTAYLSDAGMTGPHRSVIGVDIESALQKFRTGMKVPFQPATEDARLCGAIVDIEESTGLSRGIERVCLKLKD